MAIIATGPRPGNLFAHRPKGRRHFGIFQHTRGAFLRGPDRDTGHTTGIIALPGR